MTIKNKAAVGLQKWRAQDSAEVYGIPNWGREFFSISDNGHAVVHPMADRQYQIDLKKLVDEIEARGIGSPLLLRFPNILERRIRELNECFGRAIKEMEYEGRFRGVFPIKVNQERDVVDAIVRAGKPYHYGLEAGSKPELMATLAVLDETEPLIICNGYKDEEYVELAMMGVKLGRRVVVVLEKSSELATVLKMADKHRVRPLIGVRAKLKARGTGRWESSSGDNAKFGLTAGEMLHIIETLRARDMLDCLQLLHFHIGSQVSNIRSMKSALKEGSRFYAELTKLGAGMQYFDVGGGLAVDYDGSQTTYDASMNYSIQEYANDVVFNIMEVCDEAEVAHPTIVTESGRAITAHHSVLVMNVMGVAEVEGALKGEEPTLEEEDPNVLHNLMETGEAITSKNMREAYHDAIAMRDEAITMFNLGYLTLRQRAIAERLFWNICRQVYALAQRMESMPEDLEPLERILAATYFCNFSLFQSLPDNWALRQPFPIMPLHRLTERPSRQAVLGDITCDSDGIVQNFIDVKEFKRVIELHPFTGARYYLGVFLVGAYQEILGDLHNLFGDVNTVLVSMEEDGTYRVDHVDQGDTVEEVLNYVSYDRKQLISRLRASAEACMRAGHITVDELRTFMTMYQYGMDGYTYLEA